MKLQNSKSMQTTAKERHERTGDELMEEQNETEEIRTPTPSDTDSVSPALTKEAHNLIKDEYIITDVNEVTETKKHKIKTVRKRDTTRERASLLRKGCKGCHDRVKEIMEATPQTLDLNSLDEDRKEALAILLGETSLSNSLEIPAFSCSSHLDEDFAGEGENGGSDCETCDNNARSTADGRKNSLKLEPIKKDRKFKKAQRNLSMNIAKKNNFIQRKVPNNRLPKMEAVKGKEKDVKRGKTERLSVNEKTDAASSRTGIPTRRPVLPRLLTHSQMYHLHYQDSCDTVTDISDNTSPVSPTGSRLTCYKYKSIGNPDINISRQPQTMWKVFNTQTGKQNTRKKRNKMDGESIYGSAFKKESELNGTKIRHPSVDGFTKQRIDAQLSKEKKLVEQQRTRMKGLRSFARDEALLPTVYRQFFNSKQRQKVYINAMYKNDKQTRRSKDRLIRCAKIELAPAEEEREEVLEGCQYCDVLGRRYCSDCIEQKNRFFARGYERNFLPKVNADTTSLVAPRLSYNLTYRVPQKSNISISEWPPKYRYMEQYM